MMEYFGFGKVIEELKNGNRVTRKNWNGKGMFLGLQTPDCYSKMRKAYIYMSPVCGDLVPWVASQTDLLADDWHLA